MHAISPVTGSKCDYLFTSKVLGKYEVKYYYDKSIGYIFVEEPFWLEEAYSSAIALTDTGILVRNNINVSRVSKVLECGQLHVTKGVDLGGGRGI